MVVLLLLSQYFKQLLWCSIFIVNELSCTLSQTVPIIPQAHSAQLIQTQFLIQSTALHFSPAIRDKQREPCVTRAVCFTSQISQLWEFSFPSRKPTGLISARHKTGHCTSFEMRIYNTSLHLTTWNMKQINYYRPELNSQRSMYHVLLRCICFHAEITDYFLLAEKKKCCHRLWCGEVSNLYSDDWRQRYSFKTEKNKNSPMEVGYSSLKIAESV